RWIVISVKGGIEDALDHYYKLLRRRHHFYGENSVLREEIVWGSWNYNSRPKGHGDINHKHIIEQARGLKKLHPRAQWVMIDAGYQIQNPRMAESCDFICLEIFDPDAPTPHDPTRFPKGMAHTAAEIQRAGRKPAIWCSPRTHNYGWVSKRTPEWLVRFKGGRTMLNNQAYLDYSIPEVRDYTRRAWETIFCEWGYDGLKLDFWTTAFETPGLQFRNKDKTAIELRNMFMQDVRDFVPSGGYFLTCCTVNAGNPFFGLYADASRMGTDLGDGLWSQVMLGATWVSAASAFYRNACLLPDPDTIGWCPHLTEDENRLWATAALMVGGMCEIGGDMVRLTPPQRTFMRAVCDFHGPAEVCRNNLFTGGAGSVPATHWQLERGKDTVEAVLNWSGLPRLAKMKTRGKDLWTGARVAVDTTVPRHAAVVV
ncbi:MAG: alpha-galactosidase, partial [Verrucomicrobia bacterium]|nr:alpha-galactosidase [Verrucomicrobiota bacterium]